MSGRNFGYGYAKGYLFTRRDENPIGGGAAPAHGDSILMEDGTSYILLEDGTSSILKE